MPPSRIRHPGIDRHLGSRKSRFPKSDEPVQGVVLARGGNERPREIGAHLPVNAGNSARSRSADKSFECRLSQFDRPPRIRKIACDETCPAERMHPLGQVVKIPTVPMPFQPLVNRLAGWAFPERFTDPQAARGRVLAPTFVIKPTDPTAAHVVRAVPPQYPMHLIDQIRRTASIYLIACPPE